METASKSEFAALMGWSKPYVSKLSGQGRLVLDDKGRVLVAETKALLDSSADPSKSAVADRHQRDRVEKGVGVHVVPDAPADTAPPAGTPSGKFDYQSSRAQREHYLAQLAQSEALKASGDLVERAAVEQAAFLAGRSLRDLLLGLPKQIAPDLASITDPWELERMLTTHLRRVLEDASRMSAADLEQVLHPPN
tara:strand:+ start:17834 stop:18415 length:582 start_codon:yes stop_codon:yes gene_type:complete